MIAPELDPKLRAANVVCRNAIETQYSALPPPYPRKTEILYQLKEDGKTQKSTIAKGGYAIPFYVVRFYGEAPQKTGNPFWDSAQESKTSKLVQVSCVTDSTGHVVSTDLIPRH